MFVCVYTPNIRALAYGVAAVVAVCVCRHGRLLAVVRVVGGLCSLGCMLYGLVRKGKRTGAHALATARAIHEVGFQLEPLYTHTRCCARMVLPVGLV